MTSVLANQEPVNNSATHFCCTAVVGSVFRTMACPASAGQSRPAASTSHEAPIAAWQCHSLYASLIFYLSVRRKKCCRKILWNMLETELGTQGGVITPINLLKAALSMVMWRTDEIAPAKKCFHRQGIAQCNQCQKSAHFSAVTHNARRFPHISRHVHFAKADASTHVKQRQGINRILNNVATSNVPHKRCGDSSTPSVGTQVFAGIKYITQTTTRRLQNKAFELRLRASFTNSVLSAARSQWYSPAGTRARLLTSRRIRACLHGESITVLRQTGDHSVCRYGA